MKIKIFKGAFDCWVVDSRFFHRSFNTWDEAVKSALFLAGLLP